MTKKLLLFLSGRARETDAGLVTMAIPAMARWAESKSGLGASCKRTQVIGCLLAAANFALVVVFWGKARRIFAKTKTPLWLSVFYWYCAANTVFWAVGAYSLSQRSLDTKGQA
eukprot:CAMPEP_0172600470 /NCGR_PEP_ID=MMETSP1068-20121228/20672_1 /TAXON_ID=35684 /ORGANISM="Pseudopedinella elastica, Strain CCMP716" /LENGTH=112 /DNA_ID=CAMNT_0013401171 /DNA_START=81 /DNA_END=420 /DNA_ORIENTATION=+